MTLGVLGRARESTVCVHVRVGCFWFGQTGRVDGRHSRSQPASPHLLTLSDEFPRCA